MYNLYNKYIHYNEYTQTWYAFDRAEASFYLSDWDKMKTLKEYKSIEDLLKDHKTKNND
jgi:hypothetical protein